MEDTPLKNMAVQDTDFKHCRSRLLNKKNESERKKFEEDAAECILKFCGQYI